MSFEHFEWSTSSEEAQLDMDIARAAPPEALRRLARSYDWPRQPEAVLAWIMAQKSIDLGTALTVFFNGEPARFNYVAKREVPQAWRGGAQVLDNICLRVNSGFYLVETNRKIGAWPWLERWLDRQQADREAGRAGRWILDERIVGAVIGPQAPVGAAVTPAAMSPPPPL